MIHSIDYLVSLIGWQLSKNRDYKLISRIFIIPVPKIQSQLEQQLQEDWEVGIEYIDRLRKYTLQFIPLVNAINNVLENTPSESIVERIKKLVEKTEDYSIVYYLSAPLNKTIIFESIISIFPLYFIPQSQLNKIKNRFSIQIRTNTYPRAIAAIYYYAKNQQIEKAQEAFIVIKHLNNSEQLQALITKD